MNTNDGKEVVAQNQQEGAAEKSLKELIAQRHALDVKINEVHKQEKSKALASAKAIVEEYGLKAEDIFGGSGRKSDKSQDNKTKVNPKFRNSETGALWTGRGKAPKWIEGKDREQFRIPEESVPYVESTPAAA